MDIMNKKTKIDMTYISFNYLILILLFILTAYPFWYIFVVSINDVTDTIKGGITFLPRQLNFSSYSVILSDKTFTNSIFVTVLRTVIGTPFTVLCTAMLAFVFTHKQLVGRKWLRKTFIFTMYFGGGIIPTYMVMQMLGLINSFWVYILPGAIGVYYMILISAYIDGLPKEIQESAKIDGANELQIFFKFILPLSLPIIATVSLFVAIGHWNSFFDCILYTTDLKLQTLQATMVNILNQYQTKELIDSAAASAAKQQSTTPDGIRMAATVVSTLPIIMLYPFVQKYFVKGIMLGSIKE